MEIFVFTLVIFSIAFVFFAIRILIIKDGEFHGTCASQGQALQHTDVDCGVCVRKENDLCPGDDDTNLVAIAQLGNPGRTKDFSNKII